MAQPCRRDRVWVPSGRRGDERRFGDATARLANDTAHDARAHGIGGAGPDADCANRTQGQKSAAGKPAFTAFRLFFFQGVKPEMAW